MIYGNFFNGIGISEYDANKFHSIVGCDIHSKSGVTKSSLAMTKESGTTVTELCSCSVVSTNGDSFWFSGASGKIWKRTSAGVWSLVHTNTIGANLGCCLFNGYIYYASASKLGRIAIANASSEASWSSQNDSFGTFTAGDTAYKPMCVKNLSLFIGDGYLVASVDGAGTFSANVLDLETYHRITCLVGYNNYLLIGTTVASNVNQSGVFLWDTYSSSWTVEDYIEEQGVNTFIRSDNLILASCGTVGNIYYFTGEKLELMRALIDADETIATSVKPYNSANLNGLPLLGNLRGIYSIGRLNKDLPLAFNIEYVPSAGQGTTIGTILTVGGQVLASFQNGTSYGVDKLDTNRTNGVITTPVFMGKASMVKVYYSLMPTGCSIAIETKSDGGTWTAQTEVKDDQDLKIVYFDGGIGNASFVQARITLTSSTTSTPIITSIEII